jgi:Flp pilus assembly protein TadD
LPIDATLLALKPHAHYRAREIRCTATLPDGTVRTLLDIRRWDFRWQQVYRYVEPLPLPKGAVLTVDFRFDNSARSAANPDSEQRVRWGPRFVDEMADLWIQVLPKNPRDLAVLNEDFNLKWTADDIAGRETLLANDPANNGLHNEIGFLYLSVGRAEDAVRHFEAVVRLLPSSVASRLNLGAALAQAHRSSDAAAQLREALRLDPRSAPAHAALGSLALDQGQLDSALSEYRAALQLNPADPKVQNDVGFVLLNIGRPLEARPYLEEAVRLDGHFPEAHHNLALASSRLGDVRSAVIHFREALKYRSDWPDALADFAWLLATTAEPSVWNPTEAAVLAQRAALLTREKNPSALDALAAAYAGVGRFEEAASVAEAAHRLDPGGPQGQNRLSRVTLYKNRHVYREPLEKR